MNTVDKESNFPFLNVPQTTKQKANLDKWIAALESGDYEQGMGSLCKVEESFAAHRPTLYCCLGVAAKVLDVTINGIHLCDPREEYENFGKQKFEELFGLSGLLEVGLIEMNDTDGKGFQEIADFLKKIRDDKNFNIFDE
jgi:hypothetical protein